MLLPLHQSPPHPGEVLLQEFLEPLGLSQLQLAKHLGCTYAKIHEIVHGKRGVSPTMALSLADAFNVSPAFWMNLQKFYDLWHAQQSYQTKGPILKQA